MGPTRRYSERTTKFELSINLKELLNLLGSTVPQPPALLAVPRNVPGARTLIDAPRGFEEPVISTVTAALTRSADRCKLCMHVRRPTSPASPCGPG